MRKIVVVTDSLSSAQEKLLVEYFNAEDFGFWHWIKGAWLLTTHSDASRVVKTLREKIGEVAPGVDCLVFEVDAVKDWSGFGPTPKAAEGEVEKTMFTWLKKNW